jgi:L-malate glycosyltransferase
MKKILILNYEFPPLGGGAGNATYYLLKEFSKDNELEIDLVTSSTDNFKVEKFSDNITIHFLGINKKNNLHYQSNKDLLLYSWKAYWYCKKLKKQKDFNLIHAFFGIPCGYIAMKLKRKFDIPYIVSLRGSDVPFYNNRFYWLDKLLFKRLSRKIWKNAKAVITNSEGLKNLAQQTAKRQKIEVICNGVDINQFYPNTAFNQEFTIISTSRLIKRKGIDYLIDAFIDFKKKYNDSCLIIIGDGDLKDELINKVSNAGINNKVTFLGTIKHDDLPDFYQNADVFVLPSLNEGMSNSLLEAMASGLAIIATDTGGVKELINEENGFIINQKNSADIFSSLEKLYKNKDLLIKIKKNNREKSTNFSWKQVKEKYIDNYN